MSLPGSAIELVAPPAAVHIQRKPNEDNIPDRLEATAAPVRVQSKGTTTVIITAITGVTTISSLLNGLVSITLPAIAKDLDIPDALILWPSSIYSLTCGCTLILLGAVADVVGPRAMYLIGTFLQTVITLACGLSKTSTQMIVFRAFAGIAISFCLPSAVSLITTYFTAGRRRNLAFGAMGGGQPLGYVVGLVIGGTLTDAIGWQAGFYLAAGINAVLFVLALFGMPRVNRPTGNSLARLKSEVDWVGALILSTALAMLLYVFATWTGDIAKIKSAESLSCLSVGAALLPTFVIWVHRQEKLGHAVLIRNSIWRNKVFTSICAIVFLTWGAFNATEAYLPFFFLDVQRLSVTGASLRLLPESVSGALTNILVGLYVHRLQANWLLVGSFFVSAVGPLLLAVMKPHDTYWEFVFPAVTLIPVSTDVLYTISQLVITAEFDDKTQGLAGGVFNTVAQVGKSVGLAISAVIASSVTNSGGTSSLAEDRLFKGYQAAWWLTFAATVVCPLITLLTLGNIGKVGLKRE